MGEWFTRLTQTGEIETYQIRGQVQFLAPVTRASKILALGRNYRAHAEEGGYAVPDEPIFFAKASSSIIGTGADIVYPDGVQRLDPEVELAVVIGRKAKAIPEEHAMEYVAGYTILNDVTARDMQRNDIQKGKPWLRSKSFDTFCPIGPYIVLTDEITDPHNLELTLRVNGETRQRSNTAMCLFKIPQLIAYISKHMTLEPGDVIATGTPEGIAPIYRGDLVECTIAGIGSLVNRVA
ncbi:MAG: fumarylacetoacetate hydrolase family protein [Chloroflexi bacterium]|nr:fumarylacetoacetate hydrolase family protein [Chloroflexota bacterium]